MEGLPGMRCGLFHCVIARECCVCAHPLPSWFLHKTCSIYVKTFPVQRCSRAPSLLLPVVSLIPFVIVY